MSEEHREKHRNIIMNLTKEELSESGLQQYLVDSYLKIYDSEGELLWYRENYYKVDKELAVMQEVNKKRVLVDALGALVVFSIGIIVGLNLAFGCFK